MLIQILQEKNVVTSALEGEILFSYFTFLHCICGYFAVMNLTVYAEAMSLLDEAEAQESMQNEVIICAFSRTIRNIFYWNLLQIITYLETLSKQSLKQYASGPFKFMA